MPAWIRRPHWSWKRWAVVLPLGGAVFFSALFMVTYSFARIPSAADFSAHASVILDRNGIQIAQLHAEVNRVDVPLSKISQNMRDAVLAAEDHEFYAHGGVDVAAIVRAGIADVLHPRRVQGGSTITQQYVKNAYVGNRRSILRKFNEAIIAIKLERAVSKDMILERYLNTVYFGRGAYGVQAAASAFFGISADRLSVAQAAYLAGVIRAPEIYSRDAGLAKRRRDHVLDQMLALHMITDGQISAAKRTPLRSAPRHMGMASAIAPHFVQDIRAELIRRFGEDEVYRGGLVVTTTLDVRMQRDAQRAVAGVLDRPSDPNAALVSLDPATGGIRAEVGGRDFSNSQVNVITSLPGRQPGSSFKPFVLAAALQDGEVAGETFPAPAAITLPTDGNDWTVSNYDHHDYGMLNLIDATRFSVNTVFAQLITKIGPARVVRAARQAGIDSKLQPLASLALGTEVVRPLDLAAAYQTFATNGTYRRPFAIQKVVDASGGTRYSQKPDPSLALSSGVAGTVTYMLRKVIQEGTGRSADIGRPAAGKTGTTERHGDAWFAGYTPNLVTVVWMGFNDGKTKMQNVRGIAVTGGSFPAAIWRQYMEAALEGMPALDFPTPTLDVSPSPTISTISPSPSPTKTPTPAPTPPESLLPSASPSPHKSPKPSPTPSTSPSPSPT